MESFTFRPEAYGDVCAELLSTESLPLLGPGTPQQSAHDRLSTLTVDELFQDVNLRDREMALCSLSAIWLWFDFLDESHQISQRIGSTSGSYWHAIMHRREPDYSNAKYWFRKVGAHPIFDPLAVAATQLICASNEVDVNQFLTDDDGWDPFHFVDLCQQHDGTNGSAEQVCRQIARVEWQLLFDHCYQRAVGR